MNDIDAQQILEAYTATVKEEPGNSLDDWNDKMNANDEPQGAIDKLVQNIETYFNGGQVLGQDGEQIGGTWSELSDDSRINLKDELAKVMIGIVKGAPVNPPYKTHPSIKNI